MKKKKVCDFKVLEYNNNLPIINLPGSQPYNTSTLTRLFTDPDNAHPYSGVYFIGIMAFDPQGNKYYLVKVGSANDCEKRINQYFTYNPIIYTNNTYLHVSIENINLAEANCQAYLSQFADGIARGTHEWFHMSETNYFLMCDMFKDKTTFEMIAKGEID